MNKGVEKFEIEFTVEVSEPYKDINGTSQVELVDVRKHSFPIYIEKDEPKKDNQ